MIQSSPICAIETTEAQRKKGGNEDHISEKVRNRPSRSKRTSSSKKQKQKHVLQECKSNPRGRSLLKGSNAKRPQASSCAYVCACSRWREGFEAESLGRYLSQTITSTNIILLAGVSVCGANERVTNQDMQNQPHLHAHNSSSPRATRARFDFTKERS